MKSTRLMAALLLAVTMLTFFSCEKDDVKVSGTFYGESGAFGQASAKTYIELQDGVPLEIGIEITGIDLAQLHQHMLAVSLDLPKEAEMTAFKHIMFDWMPHGHEPVVFERPHFDFHLYYTTEAERLAITPTDTVKFNRFPAAGYIPEPFIPTGGVPQMGVHWIDPSEPVFNGQPFTETFIYGSYDGEVNFLETMIDKTYIEQFKSGSKPIKQPAKYPAPGKFYPTHYGFDYQPSGKTLRLSMGTFVQK